MEGLSPPSPQGPGWVKRRGKRRPRPGNNLGLLHDSHRPLWKGNVSSRGSAATVKRNLVIGICGKMRGKEMVPLSCCSCLPAGARLIHSSEDAAARRRRRNSYSRERGRGSENAASKCAAQHFELKSVQNHSPRTAALISPLLTTALRWGGGCKPHRPLVPALESGAHAQRKFVLLCTIQLP